MQVIYFVLFAPLKKKPTEMLELEMGQWLISVNDAFVLKNLSHQLVSGQSHNQVN